MSTLTRRAEECEALSFAIRRAIDLTQSEASREGWLKVVRKLEKRLDLKEVPYNGG